MIVPWQALAPETLENLLQAFVTRDGTDYGEQEYSLDEKVQQVRRALEKGDAVIVFSERSEQCNIVPADQVRDWD